MRTKLYNSRWQGAFPPSADTSAPPLREWDAEAQNALLVDMLLAWIEEDRRRDAERRLIAWLLVVVSLLVVIVTVWARIGGW